MNRKFDSLEREEETRIPNPVPPSTEIQELHSNSLNNIQEIKNKFQTYELLRQSNPREADDILRSQVLFLLSLLDFYIHEIVRIKLIEIFSGETILQKSKAYNKILITMEDFQNYQQSSSEKEWFKDIIIKKHGFLSFLSSDKIKEVFKLITDDNLFDNISKNLGLKNSDFSAEIDLIYKRRNKIAHQSDTQHGTLEQNDITKNEVIQYIDTIEKFIIEIYNEVTKKTS